MGNRPIFVTSLLALLVLAASTFVGADEEVAEKGVAATEAWLELIDRGDYGKSWETAAALFKGAVTEEQWEQQMTGLRQPMGKRIFRKILLTKFETAIPGAPDGEYVIVHYKASFENKMTSEETVIAMKDPDSQWRVAGYWLK